jgi:predicted homoserine dehydrogenase-like protein
MNLHRMLHARSAAGKPLRVALIGAGKFGAMYGAKFLAPESLPLYVAPTCAIARRLATTRTLDT